MVSKPNYLSLKWSTDKLLVIIEMKKKKKKKIEIRKHVYLGLRILNLSKINMHCFGYNYIEEKYHDKAQYCYIDTVLTTQLNHLASLAKWLSVRLRTKWLWVQVPLQSLDTDMSIVHTKTDHLYVAILKDIQKV